VKLIQISGDGGDGGENIGQEGENGGDAAIPREVYIILMSSMLGLFSAATV